MKPITNAISQASGPDQWRLLLGAVAFLCLFCGCSWSWWTGAPQAAQESIVMTANMMFFSLLSVLLMIIGIVGHYGVRGNKAASLAVTGIFFAGFVGLLVWSLSTMPIEAWLKNNIATLLMLFSGCALGLSFLVAIIRWR